MGTTRWIEHFQYSLKPLKAIDPFFVFLKSHVTELRTGDAGYVQECRGAVQDLCEAIHEFLEVRATMDDMSKLSPLKEPEMVRYKRIVSALTMTLEEDARIKLEAARDALSKRIITYDDLVFMRELNRDAHSLLEEIRQLILNAYEAHGYSLLGTAEIVGARRVGTPVREGLRASYVKMMRAIENEKTRATYYTMQLSQKLHLGPRAA
jgi:hypothetical protein